MEWMRDLVRRVAAGEGRAARPRVDALEREAQRTRRTMIGALAFSVELADHRLGLLDHCARVSALCLWIGEQVGLSDEDATVLQNAARMHEMGMISVPPELLERSAPLTAAETERVRGQARMGAQIARSMHPERVATLIEHQYEDHDRLRRLLTLDDLLLAGILRVADVVAAVSWPRPYQDPLSPARRHDLLRDGAGVRFHPLAVRAADELPTSPRTGLPELPVARPCPPRAQPYAQ